MDRKHDADDSRLRRLIRGGSDTREGSDKRKRIQPRGLFGIAALFVLTIAASLLLSQPDERIEALRRSEAVPTDETLTLTGTYGDVRASRDITVSVNPREETEAERALRLEAFLGGLPERIRGENPSTERVFLDLELPADADGIRLEWTSERPDLIDAEGTFYPEALAREEGAVTFSLSVRASLGETERERSVSVTVRPPETEAERLLYLSRRLADYTEWIGGDPTEDAVLLAGETADGIRLVWERKGRSAVLPAVLLLAAVLLFFREAKKQRAKKAEALRKRALRDAYPGFLDELILCLNAGLVFQSAVLRIAERGTEGPFYDALREIVLGVRERNLALREGFRAFSRETELPELLRFSAILDDAVIKGVDIGEKLELESLLIRNGALRTAEEKGRKAETKLAFPMVLLLASLLLVTLAPVLLEMGGQP